MIKKYVFINIDTKKGIMQTIRDYDKLEDCFYEDERVESFIVYNEVSSKSGIDYNSSKFSNLCYIGERDGNTVTTRSGRVYELYENDIVISVDNKMLCKQYI